jgi:hypothetical protein
VWRSSLPDQHCCLALLLQLLDLHGKQSYLLCDITKAFDRLVSMDTLEGYSAESMDGRVEVLNMLKESALLQDGKVQQDKGLDLPSRLVPSALALLAQVCVQTTAAHTHSVACAHQCFTSCRQLCHSSCSVRSCMPSCRQPHLACVLCLQIGENACVYELAHKALADDTLSETSRRDVTLSLVAAHCNAARDLFQEEKVGMGATLHWNAYCRRRPLSLSLPPPLSLCLPLPLSSRPASTSQPLHSLDICA